VLRFVVRYFRWLAKIPFATGIFDALLLVWTGIFHPQTLRAIEVLEAAVLKLPGVQPTRHRLGGLGFARAGREFAHVHGDGLLDVHLTRELAATIVAAGRAEPHHVFGPSAWISFRLRTPEDCAPALALLNAALDR
jgi:hypothetical protein